ncbi:MAG: DMT family transporter [Alphaproteobacteria bacterium]|nr:DMT family transporter [Alphaproteobacteria bacterium]
MAAAAPWLDRLAPFAFVLIWSSAFIAVRAGLPDVSPLYFLAVRFSLAAALLLLVMLCIRGSFAGLNRRWPHFVVVGLCINALYLGGAYVAMRHLNSATVALIQSLQPLAVALASGPLLGEHFRPLQWLGFALGILGVAFVVGLKATTGSESQGLVTGFLAIGFFIAGTLYFSRYCKAAPLLPANLVQLATGAVGGWLLVGLFERPHAEWTPTALFTLGYLVLVVSLGAMALFFYLLKTGSAGKVSANFYLTPGVTAIMGWALLGESLSALAILGFVIASLGVFLVNRG